MGATLALLAAVFALHAAPPATHDTLYTFLGDRGPVYMDYGSPAPLATISGVMEINFSSANGAIS